MRATPAWIFAGLAIGLPSIAYVTGILLIRESSEGMGRAMAALLIFPFLLAAWLIGLLGFGIVALILAKPGGALGRLLRRAGLGVLGLLAAVYGGTYLAVLVSGVEYRYVLAALIPLIGLLPVGIAAFYVLWRDMTGGAPAS